MSKGADISVASSDTTAETLTFLLYHLVSDTALWNRLSQDIRSKFASIDEITNLQLSSIQFLDAIIYESRAPQISKADKSSSASTSCTVKFTTRGS